MTKIRSLALAIILLGGLALATQSVAHESAGPATAGAFCPAGYCWWPPFGRCVKPCP